MCDCHSILECCVVFSGVKLSIRSFNLFLFNWRLVTWCHRMVVCPKKNSKPRRAVDFQALNLYATCETHHMQSRFHQAHPVPQGTIKTISDAWNGYHSVPLHVDNCHLTTFITPWGPYCYCTAPQGYIASANRYTSRYNEIVTHIPQKTMCVDDSFLGPTLSRRASGRQ